jgi:stalled ribosome rescue protein Dom34
MKYHACVWIDHRESRVLRIGPDYVDQQVIEDRRLRHHMHRGAGHVGRGTEPLDQRFLASVAKALEPAIAILIAGPGEARNELADYLREHFPTVAKRIWGIEAMDYPSDGELVAAARKHFREAYLMYE